MLIELPRAPVAQLGVITKSARLKTGLSVVQKHDTLELRPGAYYLIVKIKNYT